MTNSILGWEIFVLVVSIIGLFYAAFQSYLLLRIKVEEQKPLEISNYIKDASNAFMKRQYTAIFIMAIIIAIVIFAVFSAGGQFDTAWKYSIGFLVGSIGSAVAGLIGMNVSIRSNVRCAVASKSGLNPALRIAFRGGSVTGIIVISLALLGLIGFYMWFGDPSLMVGYIFGASLVSLFARVGGGIFTKGADVGADLVGKIEAGIPEDDPRNPAVIADNVGDNVGDCAGMGADLFETYVVTAMASMLLAYLISLSTPTAGGIPLATNGVIFPLVIGSIALLATIAGTFFVRKSEGQRIMIALYKGLVATVIISQLGFIVANYYLMNNNVETYVDTLVGTIIMLIMVYVTEYYTSERFKPVAKIAKASTTGVGTNIITGIGYGLNAVMIPGVVIIAGIVIAYGVTSFAFGASMGLYGISIAAASMLSATGIIISIDSYGPITDNAGGIAEMSGFDEKTRKEVTDPLDAVGNTTKAVTKGYAIGSALLAALTLFAAFKIDIAAKPQFASVSIDNPLVLSGLLIGAILPFFFTSYLMDSVGKAASKIVEEVRRQFAADKGILKGTSKPDYGKAVDIVTREALRQLVVPALIGVATPLVVGFILGPLAVGGLLLGVILGGFPLAIMMTVGGGAWDNAKKYIEGGEYGGKGSDAHKAAVVGDTVGDATKDTAGPAINPLVKVVNTVSILFVSLMLSNYAFSSIISLF
ncbi:MAG: sodium-translocating pyrophosphatase [Candidatus Thermoplasmatota archaeon]|jgi:K(+)-stimulated pyrophosphate-energized sodium pump|nr:sodium-translocating pyrophosphatase [Candidatus Thermoplasmatota archaeon]MCL5681101.1 sodium-translocating pyrophosphatase [Candidatus Thermoplasmatota archaeon]